MLTASFSREGKFILTASVDGTVRIWKASTAQSLAELPGYASEVSSAAFSPDGKLIAIASGDGTLNGGMAQILVCDFCGPVQDLLELARKRVTRQLTALERETYLPKL